MLPTTATHPSVSQHIHLNHQSVHFKQAIALSTDNNKYTLCLCVYQLTYVLPIHLLEYLGTLQLVLQSMRRVGGC